MNDTNTNTANMNDKHNKSDFYREWEAFHRPGASSPAGTPGMIPFFVVFLYARDEDLAYEEPKPWSVCREVVEGRDASEAVEKVQYLADRYDATIELLSVVPQDMAAVKHKLELYNV